MRTKRCTAIILAAGSGSRMKSNVAKQFMMLGGKPLIWYALQAVEQSGIIDDCILVTGEKDIPYVRQEIVEKYGFRKVQAITAGGAERCFSVANALRVIADDVIGVQNKDGYVFIHDGARPFLTEKVYRIPMRQCRNFMPAWRLCPPRIPLRLRMGSVSQYPRRTEGWFGISRPRRCLMRP